MEMLRLVARMGLAGVLGVADVAKLANRVG